MGRDGAAGDGGGSSGPSAAGAASAQERWAADLASWAIPAEILASAPESPWTFDPRTFARRADDALTSPPTTSARRALEALPDGGAVLDVGCGAGAASMPLVARAGLLVGVDASAGMLEEFEARARGRVAELRVVLGQWPGAAAEVPEVDVVVCHHVAYNIAGLTDAVVAMDERARRRVVLELTAAHPRTPLNEVWAEVHGISRPLRPLAADALAVVREAGFDARLERWQSPGLTMVGHDLDEMVAHVRRSLCVGPERDGDVARALEPRLVRRDGEIGLPPREVATLWWDVARVSGVAQE